MQRADFRHWLELPVRWGDMDALGHVNNVQFLRYLESARVAYVETVVAGRIGGKDSVILADIQCSFLRQLHYPMNVEIGTRISRLGSKSATITAAIYPQGEDHPAAVSRAILVWFDFAAQASVVIPTLVREAVCEFEQLAPEC